MNWFFSWLGRKIRRADQDEIKSHVVSASRTHDGSTSAPSTRRVEIVKAINGNLIEVWTRSAPHQDWKAEVYIVKDDESLADAIATVLLITKEN
jgi:hypothetical protein